MKEERKRILSQWLFPTLVLVIVIAGMIINFNIQSRSDAVALIEKEMIVVGERYAAELHARLVAMAEASTLTAETIYLTGSIDNAEAIVPFLDSLVNSSAAYAAAYVDLEGTGVMHDGSFINIGNYEYFGELLAGNLSTYAFAPPFGSIETSSVAHITYIPGDDDVIISYYPIETMGDSIRKNDFNGDVLYMLLNRNGDTLSHNYGYESNYLQPDNVIEALRRQYGTEVSQMDRRLNNGIPGAMKVSLNSEERSLVYVPFPINQWRIVVGVRENYVTSAESKVWEFARRTLLQLAMVIGGFIILMVIINMFSKLRSTANTKALMEKADTDLLTGLYNKVATERKVQEYFEAHPDEQALLFVLDIDNFKKINDTMGHAFGDEVLRSLGQQITPQFRATDIIGRIGGDELIILLKNIHTDESLVKEATKVARFFHDFKAGEYVKYSATASIGVAIFSRDGQDFESLYKAADQALYMAKKRGKNQLAFYHDNFEAIVIR